MGRLKAPHMGLKALTWVAEIALGLHKCPLDCHSISTRHGPWVRWPALERVMLPQTWNAVVVFARGQSFQRGAKARAVGGVLGCGQWGAERRGAYVKTLEGFVCVLLPKLALLCSCSTHSNDHFGCFERKYF